MRKGIVLSRTQKTTLSKLWKNGFRAGFRSTNGIMKKQKLWLLICGASFLLSLFIFQFACTEVLTGASDKAYAQDNIADLNEWDFGQVKPGAVLKHNFIFKNQTKDVLGINNILTSCGCTVSESDKKFLKPQESTTITVSFNSKGYLGPVTQFVYVNTDNADLAITKFTIKALVVKD